MGPKYITIRYMDPYGSLLGSRIVINKYLGGGQMNPHIGAILPYTTIIPIEVYEP